MKPRWPWTLESDQAAACSMGQSQGEAIRPAHIGQGLDVTIYTFGIGGSELEDDWCLNTRLLVAGTSFDVKAPLVCRSPFN